MGMFDYVICEYDVPGMSKELSSNTDFQTKSLGSSLSTFRISKEGGLWVKSYAVDLKWVIDILPPKEEVSEEEKESRKEQQCDYHGDLIFYADIDGDGHKKWVEFIARFTSGVLLWIKDFKEYKAELEAKHLLYICDDDGNGVDLHVKKTRL